MPISLIVPPKLPISPVHRLSPALYTSFEDCRLKGVLHANKIPSLLPKHPRAYLGTIIHAMIAKDVTGQLSEFDRFQTEWDAQVASIEKQLQQSDFTKHLVPLSKNISNMSQSKSLCWDRIRSKAKCPKEKKVFSKCYSPAYNLPESWVQSSDGLVGGFIDSIIYEPGGSIIVEFKTGNVLADNSERDANTVTIKPEYLTQVYLYAGLFQETKGYWPSGIRIVTTDGKEYQIPYDENSCTSLLHKAKKYLSTTNCTIRKLYRNYDALSDKLAAPKAKSCTKCNYRPSCKQYWSKKSRVQEEWPLDCHVTIRF